MHSSDPNALSAKHIQKFPLAPMGVLAPGSVHAGPSAQPPINPICTGGFGLFLSTGGADLPPYVKFSEPPLNEIVSVYILLA